MGYIRVITDYLNIRTSVTTIRNDQSLLSLLLPSCIVAFIRELANIQFSTLAFNSKSLQITNSPSYMDMVIDCALSEKG